MYLSLNAVYLILRNSVCTMIKMYSKNSLLKFHPSTKLYLIFGSIHSMNWKTTIHLQCQKRLWPHCHTIDATSKWVEINSDRTFLFYCKFSFDLKEMRWISHTEIKKFYSTETWQYILSIFLLVVDLDTAKQYIQNEIVFQ